MISKALIISDLAILAISAAAELASEIAIEGVARSLSSRIIVDSSSSPLPGITKSAICTSSLLNGTNITVVPILNIE